MDANAFPAASAAVGIAVAWLALAALSMAESERVRLVNRAIFPASAVISLVLAAVAFRALTAPLPAPCGRG